jgi:NAD+ kinase
LFPRSFEDKVNAMKAPRILVVHRRSAYTDIISDNRHPEIKQMIRRKDPLVQGLVDAHKHHTESMRQVKQALVERKTAHTWRHHIGDIDPDDFDLVVTVGGDGTVLHASHAICDTPVLAVNSSPETSVGFFTCTDAAGFGQMLDRVLAEEREPVRLSRMKVKVNDSVVTDRALNDALFCHDCPASTTRYVLSFNGISEYQLSSGVWIATAAGSTAAIKAAGGKAMTSRSRRLQFLVREPCPTGGAAVQARPETVRGFIPDGEALTIFSKTERARLYVDGPHVVFSVNFGDKVSLSNAHRPLRLFTAPQK